MSSPASRHARRILKSSRASCSSSRRIHLSSSPCFYFFSSSRRGDVMYYTTYARWLIKLNCEQPSRLNYKPQTRSAGAIAALHPGRQNAFEMTNSYSLSNKIQKQNSPNSYIRRRCNPAKAFHHITSIDEDPCVLVLHFFFLYFNCDLLSYL